ncbi:flavodoxin domain-containing protein [Gordonia defluvii]|jgi:menaquinone-dependent protoporphyrinogen oxidase|uniref:Flavodoxin domain-containing protein n=1 Tax=Gordonia defluvii TaxID=283718 RepID=A0ABP6LES6_9ACTN|nr:flavodoxin domain-containing protein [Gordonia sp. UBA5067]
MTANVLVAYASADGSTAEVAQRLGEHLRATGLQVRIAPATDSPDPTVVDAVILGSPIHDGALLPELTAFVDANLAALLQRPVWLFSLGMGPVLRGPIGALLRTKVTPPVAGVRDTVNAVEYHAFAGRFARSPQLRIRAVMGLLGAVPGDHRNWDEVAQWAADISRVVRARTPD